MPAKDKTGPLGQGVLTGRGLGYCGTGISKNLNRGYGWKCRGRFRFSEPLVLTKAEEKKILEAELKEIDLEKQEIEKRLKEI